MEQKFSTILERLTQEETKKFRQEIQDLKLGRFDSQQKIFFKAIELRKVNLIHIILNDVNYVKILDEKNQRDYIFKDKLLNPIHDRKSGRLLILDLILHYGDRLSNDVAGFVHLYKHAKNADETNQLEQDSIKPVTYFHKILEIEKNHKIYKWMSKIVEKNHPTTNFTELVLKYKKELQTLDAVILGNYPRYTMYNFIKCNSYTFSKYFRNGLFNKMYKDVRGNFKNIFPEYGDIINYIYITTKKRYDISEKAKNILNKSLGIFMDDSLTEKILGNLSETDLHTMTERSENISRKKLKKN